MNVDVFSAETGKTLSRFPSLCMEEVQLHGLGGRDRGNDRVVSPFNKLVDDAPPHGHTHSATPITVGTKVVFGLGFAIETMFDVASDTLLAKFYSGTAAARLPRRARGTRPHFHSVSHEGPLSLQ